MDGGYVTIASIEKELLLKVEKRIYDVMILGAGASGMMCAAQLNEQSDLSVVVIEGNERAGKKLKISGGGKCNITNIAVSAENYLGDEQLIESVFSQFSKDDLLQWLEVRGLQPVLRKELYYFCPKSADEIISILEDASRKSVYRYNEKIVSLKRGEDGLFTLRTEDGRFQARKVVVATGAKSFASVGATDIGLELAASLGHSVTPFVPALAGFTLQPKAFWMKELSGVSFRAAVTVGEKVLREDMLMTHRGLSGPVILSASLYWEKGEIEIDFLPDYELEKLLHNNRKLLSTALPLPKRFTQKLLEVEGIKDKACNIYKGDELERLQRFLHHYTLAPAGTYGFAKAEVCKGGVNTSELNSWTLESNTVEGIYFVGEVIDVTGELGGYNFQWAFSSGAVAAFDILGQSG